MLQFQNIFSLTRTFFSHRRSEQFWFQNTIVLQTDVEPYSCKIQTSPYLFLFWNIGKKTTCTSINGFFCPWVHCVASERVHDDIVCSTTPHNMRVLQYSIFPHFSSKLIYGGCSGWKYKAKRGWEGEINPLIETVNGSKLLSKLF